MISAVKSGEAIFVWVETWIAGSEACATAARGESWLPVKSDSTVSPKSLPVIFSKIVSASEETKPMTPP